VLNQHRQSTEDDDGTRGCKNWILVHCKRFPASALKLSPARSHSNNPKYFPHRRERESKTQSM